MYMAKFLVCILLVCTQPLERPKHSQPEPPKVPALDKVIKEPWILLPKAEQEALGLDRLGEQQRAAWSAFYWKGASIARADSALSDSAAKYLRGQGWDEVQVVGTRTIKDEFGGRKEYLVIKHRFTTYLCDSFRIVAPGKYFGEVGFTRVRLIDHDGVERSLFVDKTE